MEKVLEGLKSLVETVGQNMKGTLLVLLLLIVTIGGIVVVDKIAEVQKHFPDAAVENQRFVTGIKTDQLIKIALTDVRVQIGATRVVVNQFHNNQVDIAGLPFMKSTVTSWSAARGFEPTTTMTDDIPISTWNPLIVHMYSNVMKPNCTMADINTTEDNSLHDRMTLANIQVLYACPILSLSNGTIGMLTVGYNDRTKVRPDDATIYKIVGDLGVRVGGFLQANSEKPKPWYSRVWDAL